MADETTLQNDGTSTPELDLSQINDANVTYDEGTDTESAVEPVLEADGKQKPQDTTQADKDKAAAQEKADNEKYEAEMSEYARKKINKKHFEAEQAKRERDEYKQRLEALEEKKDAGPEVKPELPEFPDQFDPDFDAKKEQYIQAAKDQAAWEIKQAARLEAQKTEWQKQQDAAVKAQAEVVKAFSEKIKAAGFDEDETRQKGDIIESWILNQEFKRLIAINEKAPEIVNFLGDNPEELQALSKMDMVTATNYLYSSIVPRASKIKPKLPDTPAPARQIRGSGRIPDTENTYLKGCTFE